MNLFLNLSFSMPHLPISRPVVDVSQDTIICKISAPKPVVDFPPRIGGRNNVTKTKKISPTVQATPRPLPRNDKNRSGGRYVPRRGLPSLHDQSPTRRLSRLDPTRPSERRRPKEYERLVDILGRRRRSRVDPPGSSFKGEVRKREYDGWMC